MLGIRFFSTKENSLVRRGFQVLASVKRNAISATLEKDEINVEYASARPFKSIPGPKPLPVPYIGNLWRLLPFGTYGNMEMSDTWKILNKKYGPIVKFEGLGDFSHVILFEPELTEKMFRNESSLPRRRPLKCAKYYREVLRKDFYESELGLFIDNGENWHKFRSATNQVMLNPKTTKMYLKPVVNVCNDFIERIRFIRNSEQEMPDNFFEEINKLTLETFMFMAVDKRLGCFAKNSVPNDEAPKVIQSVRDMFNLMYKLDFRPSLWRFYPTKDWKKFVRTTDYLISFTDRYIMEKWEKIKNQKENDVDNGDDVSENRSILENLLLRTKNPKIAIVMASDTLLAAVDSTSSTMASTLYYLATNPEKQEKLYGELKRLLPRKDSEIEHEILNELKYTRAVIKETMRLQPAAAANQREAVKDMVLNNYQIPKGTVLISANASMCQEEKHFKNPQEFMPERWLKSETSSEFSYKNTHSFVHLPFGFGLRSCLGKRLAYLEMDVVISKIIRNFKISYHHEPMKWVTKFFNLPDKPLKFKMEDRNN